MGNKNRKNSNYVTEKTIQAKADKERAERQRKQKRLALIITSSALALAILVGGIVAIGKYVFGWGEGGYEPTVTHHAHIEIEEYGTLHVELYGEEAPKTVENFVNLANEGFYDGLSFSSLMQDPRNDENVLIQAGDENTAPDIEPIYGEYSDNGFENKVSHKIGVLSAPSYMFGTHPTKFFIMTSSDYSDMFDGSYAAFGKITDGLDILREICEESEKNITSYDEKNLGDIHPKKRIKIKSITIHESH